MNHKVQVLMISFISTAIITGCGGGSSSSGGSGSSQPSNNPPVESPTNPVESPTNPVESTSSTSALQAALYYFNENALGPINEAIQIPSGSGVSAYSNPVVWRGNSFVADGLTIINGQFESIPNLNTGFADAGDTIKYNLPQAYAMTILAWSGVEFESAHKQSNTYNNLSNVLRWGMNYMLNCWRPDKNSANPESSANSYLIVQTGIGAGAEHNLWVADEPFEQAIHDNNQGTLPAMPIGSSNIPYQRIAYYVNIAHPGPDLAGAMASAMAAGATFFAKSPVASDHTLATQLYKAAQQLLIYGQNMAAGPGCNNGPHCVYNQNLGYSGTGGVWEGTMAQADATTTYNDAPGIPNYYAGKLALAALWLAQASNALDGGQNYQNYLTLGENILSNASITAQDSSWTFDWANFYYGAFLLLAKMDPNRPDPVSQSQPKYTYAQDVQSWLNNLKNSAAANPGGFGYLAGWEALRYAADSSFSAALGDKYLNSTQFESFALTQLNYIQGANPAGYNYEIGISGIGSLNAANAHNATAQASWTQSQNLYTYTVESTNLYAHPLLGALVGGPANANGTGYNPVVTDYGTNEPTIDGNASFVGALAAQYSNKQFNSPGVFPPVKPTVLAWPEFYGNLLIGESSITYQGYQQQNLTITLFNHSAWPARIIYNQQAIVYFNFSDMPESQSINNGIVHFKAKGLNFYYNELLYGRDLI